MIFQDLLYRRMRCLANYESANKNLERARAKNRDIQKVRFLFIVVPRQTRLRRYLRAFFSSLFHFIFLFLPSYII